MMTMNKGSETNPHNPKTRRNLIAVSVIVILLISAYFVINHLLPPFPAPEFRISEPCLKSISLKNKTLWNLILRNTGRAGGTAGLCLTSNSMVFERLGYQPTNKLCFEKAVGADTNELFTFDVSPDPTIVKRISKGQIDVEVRCSREFLYLFRIGCRGIDYSCIYGKGNSSFGVERAVYR
jgi:hypothetical protein